MKAIFILDLYNFIYIDINAVECLEHVLCVGLALNSGSRKSRSVQLVHCLRKVVWLAQFGPEEADLECTCRW